MFFLLSRTLVIYFFITFAIRFMGKRQLGELQPSELVSTVLVSNLASICIEEPSLPIFYSILPVLFISVLELVNSALAFRLPAYERFISGKPVSVIHDGKIDQTALREMRLTVNDLLKALRSQGEFSPAEVALAIVETDGSLSVLPQKEKAAYLPLVVDGCMMEDNLLYLGVDDAWLKEQLAAHGYRSIDALLLVISDGKNIQVTETFSGKE